MARVAGVLSRRGFIVMGVSAFVAVLLPFPAASGAVLPEQVVMPRVRLDTVIQGICLNFGISRELLLSEDRSRYVVRARQYGMYLAHTLTKRSLPEIGRRFGNRDHTTVLYAARKIGALIETAGFVAEDIAFLIDCVRHMEVINRGGHSVLDTPMTVGRSFFDAPRA